MALQEHIEIFDYLLKDFEKTMKYNIIDVGSGFTSLSIITNTFINSTIDAIVYPGDLRKINSIREKVISDRYELIEQDICTDIIHKNYDIAIAHLLLGEASKFGNDFNILLQHLFEIKCKYLIVIDFMEDPDVDFNEIKRCAIKNHFEILSEYTVNKSDIFIGKSFVGLHYQGFLFQHMM